MADDVPITPGTGVNVETLQQPDANLSQRQVVHVGDFKAAFLYALEQITNPMWVDQSARMRISIENINGAAVLSSVTTIGTVTTVTTVSTVTTVGTVTTVSTVSNLAQIGGVKGDTMILDAMMNSWSNGPRGRIQ